jgi:hypothetical protein
MTPLLEQMVGDIRALGQDEQNRAAEVLLLYLKGLDDEAII